MKVVRPLFFAILMGVVLGLSGCWGNNDADKFGVSAPYTSLLIDPTSCVCTSDDTASPTSCKSIEDETNLILVSCDTVYASTRGNGVFRTTNAGVTWGTFGDGLIDPFVNRLALDPLNPTRIYAGTENLGVFFVDVDQSTIWISPTTNVFSGVIDIVIDPHSCFDLPPCRTLYAGSQTEGVFISEDQGENWELMTTSGMTQQEVTRLALGTFVVPTVVYAAVEGGHVFKFSNIGVSPEWEEGMPGLTAVTQEEIVALKVLNPLSPSLLFAAISGGETGGGGGVFRTGDDGGNIWSKVDIPVNFPDSVFVLEYVDVDGVITLYASVDGLSRASSEDNFTFWDQIDVGTDSRGVTTLAIDPFTGTTLYAGTFNGELFKSVDRGANWELVDITF